MSATIYGLVSHARADIYEVFDTDLVEVMRTITDLTVDVIAGRKHIRGMGISFSFDEDEPPFLAKALVTYTFDAAERYNYIRLPVRTIIQDG